jgi:hypothetical protein
MAAASRSKASSLVLLLTAVLFGCGSTAPSTAGLSTASASGSPTASSGAPDSTGVMQVRIVNLTDGGSAPVTFDATGRPLVTVQVEVTGVAPVTVSLTANGLPVLDEGGHVLEVLNAVGVVPLLAEIPWSPATGGGQYTLTATAMDDNKNQVEATVHITVTGVAASTPMPPPLTQEQAKARVSELIMGQGQVRVPAPSLLRFDVPISPARSRWIGAAYYKGMRYYVQVYDDEHVEWSGGPYADPAHRPTSDVYYFCRPAGTYRVLVVFVDYGNTGTAKSDALAQVPVVVTWLNGLYADYAVSQGFSSTPMKVEAEAGYVASPPAPGKLLTAAQIRTLTGKDPAAFDFTMEIDLDANGTFGEREFPGLMVPGGGIALQGCGSSKFGPINIWSSMPDAPSLQGGLVMDFNHEFSHLFGMMDDGPYRSGVAGPDGSPIDDWIPYVLFGWTDTDGDGIREIVDTTPYGTTGPLP